MQQGQGKGQATSKTEAAGASIDSGWRQIGGAEWPPHRADIPQPGGRRKLVYFAMM